MNPASVTAFSPGHISGYFRRICGDTPAATGSIGAGIVITEGVTATVTPAGETSIRIIRNLVGHQGREEIPGSPLLSSVIGKLGVTARVVTECRLPIGSGFGLSAAALLATLTALDRLFALGLSRHDIAACAHEAEVLHRTGLGDVAASQGGGFVIRRSPGIDGLIERQTAWDGQLCSVSFGPIHTPTVLGTEEKMRQVASAFPASEPSGLPDFFALCREFDRDCGLVTPEVSRVLEACDRAGVQAAMTMLGNGVFACGPKAAPVLGRFGEVYGFRVARTGALITEVGP
ncbi:MAG TPA: pantoate kinase [Methanoregula sp.]|nr:pantoate kinase [Methanoregula sp.]